MIQLHAQPWAIGHDRAAIAILHALFDQRMLAHPLAAQVAGKEAVARTGGGVQPQMLQDAHLNRAAMPTVLRGKLGNLRHLVKFDGRTTPQVIAVGEFLTQGMAEQG